MRQIEVVNEIRGFEPGSIIHCADSEMERYVAAGDAKWVAEQSEEIPEDKPLEERTKDELIEVCKSFDLPIYGTKDELLQRITEAKFP